jgi:hypothetical protein
MLMVALGAGDALVGFGTLALAIATFGLAGIAFWQLNESRRQRAITERSLDIAEATLAAQQHPELVAFQDADGEPRLVHLATYGTTEKPVGAVWARVDLMNANVGVISFDVRNIGAGAAEIIRMRVMSLDTLRQGGGPTYWEPDRFDRPPVLVPAGGVAPVDLVMAPNTPSWFNGHLTSSLKFWVELTYRGLGGGEIFVRWFEFQTRAYQPYPWFISQVLRTEPQPFSNVPVQTS